MAFWNSETLRARLPELITGYDEKNVVTGSYELGLGSEAYITGQKKKIQLGEKGHVVIPPGQFALLITEERIRIPADAIGFISIKSKYKLWGLINVSGFHVDPGFDGKLIFSVYNAGVQDIVVSRKKRMFLLWLSSMDEPGEGYKGPRLGQTSIPDEDMMKIRGEIPSPQVLQRRIERLQNKVTTYTSIAGVLIGLMVAILVKVFIYDPLQTKVRTNERLQESPTPIAYATSTPAPISSPSPTAAPSATVGTAGGSPH